MKSAKISTELDAQIRIEIGELAQRVKSRETLSRETAAILFFRYGIYPSIQLVHRYTQFGSLTDIGKDLEIFWQAIREKGRFRLDGVDLPDNVIARTGEVLAELWQLAQAKAKQTLDDERQEIHSKMADMRLVIEKMEQQYQASQARADQAEQELKSVQHQKAALDKLLATERIAKETAMLRVADLTQRIEAMRVQNEAVLQTIKAKHEKRMDRLQSILTAKEQEFHDEINKTTARLESVQKHVMLQVEQAREAHKQAEAQLNIAHQKNERLVVELQQAKSEIFVNTQSLSRAQAKEGDMSKKIAELGAERESLSQQLAMATGKLNAQVEQIQTLEDRLVKADVRIQEMLKQTVWSTGFI
jgi:chromosome segregation ATPase